MRKQLYEMTCIGMWDGVDGRALANNCCIDNCSWIGLVQHNPCNSKRVHET